MRETLGVGTIKNNLKGLCLSTCIELMQLILCRGLCEFDDVIHNSLDCMIGAVVTGIVIEKIKR